MDTLSVFLLFTIHHEQRFPSNLVKIRATIAKFTANLKDRHFCPMGKVCYCCWSYSYKRGRHNFDQGDERAYERWILNCAIFYLPFLILKVWHRF